MNELSTIQQGDEPALIEVRLAPAKYPRVAATERAAALTTMTGIVGSAYMLLGKVADKEMVNFTAVNLLNEMLRDIDGLGTKNLSWYEVSYAIRRAILSADVMYTISVASLYRALRAYIQGEGLKADKEARARYIARRKASEGVQAFIDASSAEMARPISPPNIK